MEKSLSQRQINRALLSRQMLLERQPVSVLDAITYHIGFQAQAPNPPYFALWDRVKTFDQAELSALFTNRKVVRIALMRSTIFLVTAEDCLELRPLLQSAVHHTFLSGYSKRAVGLDINEVARVGRKLVEEQPRTFKQLGEELGRQWPDYEPAVMAEVIRSLVPLIQIPPRGLWGTSGAAAHTSAEVWLDRPLNESPSIDNLVIRYFDSFGPATIADLQHWSGIRRLREVVERNLDHLVRIVDASGNERFDIAGCAYPNEETPAPVRFLGEFDNLLLSHANRTHVISDEDRRRVFTNNGIIRPTILIDGFVHGMWKLHQTASDAFVEISPFRPLGRNDRHELELEGERLLAFVAPEKTPLGVRFSI